MIQSYTPDLLAELARRHDLPLPEDRLETVAATLTHVRRFIATLETSRHDDRDGAKEAASDETL